MRVLVLTYGTTGDVVPYVALGKGLKKRGHSVVICANSRFEEFITRHGLEYAYMSDEITQLIESATGRSAMEGLSSFFGFLVTVLKLMRRNHAIQVEILHDTWTAAQQHEPDLILFSPKNIAGVHFAEKLNIPAVSAPLFPQFIPSALSKSGVRGIIATGWGGLWTLITARIPSSEQKRKKQWSWVYRSAMRMELLRLLLLSSLSNKCGGTTSPNSSNGTGTQLCVQELFDSSLCINGRLQHGQVAYIRQQYGF